MPDNAPFPDFQSLVQSETPVLVDFWATWCGPCKTMFPVLEAVQIEMGDQIKIEKLDVDQHLELAVAQKVMGVPTFVLYQNGRELWREAGVLSKDQLKSAILSHLQPITT